MKTLIISGALILLIQGGLSGQNSSYNINATGQSGIDCCAFGWNALIAGNSNRNTAVGFEAIAGGGSHVYGVTAFGAYASKFTPLVSFFVVTGVTALGYESLLNSRGNYNTAAGYRSMTSNTDGQFNSGIGSEALILNTQGSYNNATGYQALYSNQTGDYNTALGAFSMYSNTGGYNTAAGTNALYNCSNGLYNTAIGKDALYSTPTGGLVSGNTAVGARAMAANFTGLLNTAVGMDALNANDVGNANVACGRNALVYNTSGSWNVAIGEASMIFNTTGNRNVGVGFMSLIANVSGDDNTGLGAATFWSMSSGNENTAVGTSALMSLGSGDRITGVGAWTNVSGATNYDATAFGAGAIVNANYKVVLGDVNTLKVRGAPNAWSTWTSDQRFKSNVKEEVKGLEFIMKLRPVVYNFDTRKFQEFLTRDMVDSVRKIHMSKNFSKSTAVRHSGFIAQEIEKAMDETGYQFSGLNKPRSEYDNYSVHYSMFVVPLVKAVQEQDQAIVAESASSSELLDELALLEKKLDDLGSTTMAVKDGGSISLPGKDFSMEVQPNPFSDETVVKYNLPANVKTAELVISNLEGRQIVAMPVHDSPSGSIVLTSERLSPGMYTCAMIAGGKVLGSKRLVVAGK